MLLTALVVLALWTLLSLVALPVSVLLTRTAQLADRDALERHGELAGLPLPL